MIVILKQRRAEAIGRWIYRFCVKPLGTEGNVLILCREFVASSGYEIDIGQFCDALLAAGFQIDDDGFVHGLILRIDDEASRG